jgi:hypothetical protein
VVNTIGMPIRIAPEPSAANGCPQQYNRRNAIPIAGSTVRINAILPDIRMGYSAKNTPVACKTTAGGTSAAIGRRHRIPATNNEPTPRGHECLGARSHRR